MQQGERAVVFVRGGVEEEALAVGSDVKFDHALAIGTLGGLESKEPDGMSDFDASRFFRDRDDAEFIAEIDEIEFLAITAPTRPLTALCGDLPQAVAGGKRNDEDLRAVRGRHGER